MRETLYNVEAHRDKEDGQNGSGQHASNDGRPQHTPRNRAGTGRPSTGAAASAKEPDAWALAKLRFSLTQHHRVTLVSRIDGTFVLFRRHCCDGEGRKIKN